MVKLIGAMVVTFMLAVTQAEATCAWVLWQKSAAHGGKSEWAVIQANSTEMDCDAAQTAKVRHLAERANPKLLEQGNFVYGKYASNGLATV
jgi:hypothetical protein